MNGIRATAAAIMDIEPTEGPIVMGAPMHDYVTFPSEFNVHVGGLPWDVVVTMRYDTRTERVQVVGLNVQAPAGAELPARGLRAFQLEALRREAIEMAAHPGRFVGASEGNRSGVEPIETEQVNARFIDHLLRGRTKHTESIRMLREQAAREYALVRAEPGDCPDIIAEVARRIHVGRSTAGRYLKEAGVTGGGK